jgi:DNA-directed RNA polymerase specialized sigma24 family protein
MRFFAGLSLEETAEVLGKSTRTIEREWRYVRAVLYRSLSPQGRGEPQP